MENQSEQIGIN